MSGDRDKVGIKAGGEAGAMNPPHWASILVAIRQRLTGPIPPSLSRLPFEMSLRVRSIERTCSARFSREGEPTCCYPLSAVAEGFASPQGIWMEFSPAIAYPMLDMLLGGSGHESPTVGRPLTAIERRLLVRPAEALTRRLAQAWQGDASVSCQVLTEAGSARAVKFPSPDEPAALLTIDLSAGAFSGSVRLCMGEGLLEAMSPAARHQAPDGQAPIEISVTAADLTLSAEELTGLSAGDILITETPADGEVVVRLAGIPKFTARLGSSNGRRAVTITGRIQSHDGA